MNTSPIENTFKQKDRPFILRMKLELMDPIEYQGVLICVLEGADYSYYSNWLERLEIQAYPLRCGGRDAVLKLKEFIVTKEFEMSFAYFIDKDYREEAYHDQDVFETNRHSIESYYTDQSVICSILEKVYGINCTFDSDGKMILNQYNLLLSEFTQAIDGLNSVLSYIDRINYKLTMLGCPRDKLIKYQFPEASKLKNYINFSYEKITKKYNFEEIYEEADAIVKQHINYQSVADITIKKGHSNLNNIRGKYLLQFVLEFLNICVQKRKIKNHPSINLDAALGLYAHHATEAMGLKQYLTSI